MYEVDPLLCPRCGGTMEVAAHSRDWSYEPLFDDIPVPEPVTV
ncbi:MAG TPA: hypothetical protein VGC81_15905 [Candidatus Methylomirabilis sp.]